MTTLQFTSTPSASPSRSAAPRPAPKPVVTVSARGESLLMRFARGLAQARIDWATGGRG